MSRANTAGLAALLVALVVIVALSLIGGQREVDAQVPYSSTSASPNGTLALHDWLSAIGYAIGRRGAPAGDLPPADGAVVILPALQERDALWSQDLLAWVRDGGTLIVLQPDLAFNPLLRELGVAVRNDFMDRGALRVGAALPGATAPPAPGYAVRWLELDRPHAAHIIGREGPALISFPEGGGRIYVTTIDDLFTNDGLREEANARWARAMLAPLPAGSSVIFDQTRLGVTYNDQPGFNQVLFTTPWGWAVLFSAAALALYVIVNGRRFGRALPPNAGPALVSASRRDPAEYVVSTAGLFQRAGKREMVLRHFHRSAKHRLGRRWQVSASLPDEAFVDALARAHAGVGQEIDRDRLLRLLQAVDPARAGALTDRDALERVRALQAESQL